MHCLVSRFSTVIRQAGSKSGRLKLGFRQVIFKIQCQDTW